MNNRIRPEQAMERMVVAAVQLNAELGNVPLNLTKAIELARQAAEQGAKIIVLPEFFTSAMAFHPCMEEVAIRNKELNVPQRFYELARRYACLVVGSYLNISAENIYNSMLIQFPNGEQFMHNKDIPTQFENRYYTKGDSQRGKNGIGVALCWEMLRSQTIFQMNDTIRIVAAASCWWDLPAGSLQQELRAYNHALNANLAPRFAALLGVPVIHAAHVGVVSGYRSSASERIVTRQLLGTTQIVNREGNVQKELDIRDGDAIVVDDVTIAPAKRAREQPPGFWNVDLPTPFLTAWEQENNRGQEYYALNRRRMLGSCHITIR